MNTKHEVRDDVNRLDTNTKTKLGHLEHHLAALQKTLNIQDQKYDGRIGRLEENVRGLHETVTYKKQKTNLTETTYKKTKLGKTKVPSDLYLSKNSMKLLLLSQVKNWHQTSSTFFASN